MFNYFTGSKKKESDKKSDDFEIEDPFPEDSAFLTSLQTNLSRLIAYAESADPALQREVAEKLANEAVNPARQVQIVEYGGLKLLIPLARSSDIEVQRLSAHALANLSVNSDNQKLMAAEGAIEVLVQLLHCTLELTQRQSAKALANLGVNGDNKRLIALAGGIPVLVNLAGKGLITVRIEAIAALANLAVNDSNEVEIVQSGGLEGIISGLTLAHETLKSCNHGSKSSGLDAKRERELANIEELGAQCARALRNLSVNPSNKMMIIKMGAIAHLEALVDLPNQRINEQAKRALRNLESNFKK